MTVLEKLTAIFREEFENDSLVIDESTTPTHIEKWDSLAMINIIVASEWEFKIKFDTTEIKSIRGVSEILQIIENKTK